MFTPVKKNPHKSLTYRDLSVEIVTAAGFEPATFGAEIRNSIQLNYAAVQNANLLIVFK